MKKIKYILTLVSFIAIVVQGCKEDEVFQDPYSGAKEPLGVTLRRDLPAEPSSGEIGSEVTVQVSGLMAYKDELQFMFNGQQAEVMEVTDSHIKVKVPKYGSSGVTSIAIGDQLIIGPYFTVEGKVNVDPTWVPAKGTNGTVNQFYGLTDGRYLLLGGFTNYDDKGIVSPLNRIVRISGNGDLDRSFRTGNAANGELSDVVLVGDRFAIAGGFSGYGQRNNISNITMLNPNGSIDSVGVRPFRRPDQSDTLIYVPRFNGGTNSYISKIYNVGNKIVATGNFRYYVSRRYDQPNYTERRDTIILDSIEARQIIRLLPDGSLDKTYRFNQATGTAFTAANGNIATYMHTDGAYNQKLLVFGKFNTFDGEPAVNIVRLNPDGTKDNTFNPGSGPDNNVNTVTYNPVTQKYVLTGSFRTYNGQPAERIAVVNLDGSLDNTFKARALGGGYPGFAKQLNDGLIVVSGGFKTYNNIARNGFMILTPDGDIAEGYNNTGIFSGFLNNVVETTSADGKRALLLYGAFSRFDNKQVYNILRVTIE